MKRKVIRSPPINTATLSNPIEGYVAAMSHDIAYSAGTRYRLEGVWLITAWRLAAPLRP